jgi:hypothetical protein
VVVTAFAQDDASFLVVIAGFDAHAANMRISAFMYL